MLLLVCAWFTGLGLWANSKLSHVEALSGAADTPGTTYLIAGSDARSQDGPVSDRTPGQRADTIMLLHKADSGATSLVSLPRDTLVDIPERGRYKLNAAYAFGGPSLLVRTVEGFTGMTVDHYTEVGFAGVTEIVDAVGTVNLCVDQDVDDKKSGLKMTEGCHDVGGETALSFVRARGFDPTSDIGRMGRQQEFIRSLTKEIAKPSVLLNPLAHARLADAGTGAVIVDEDMNLFHLGAAAFAFKGATGEDGVVTTIPIDNPAVQTQHSGVAVGTDDDEIAEFFSSVEDGTISGPVEK